MYSNILLCFMICAYCISQSSQQLIQQAEETLTDSPLSKIFFRSNNEIPKNEEIPMNNLTDAKPRKKTRQLELTRDGQKYKLHLTPVKHNVMSSKYTVWIVEPDPESEFSETLNELYYEDTVINGTFYEDPDNMATILINHKDEQAHYDGLFGENKFMKTLGLNSDRSMESVATEVKDNFMTFDVTEDNFSEDEENGDESNSTLLEKPIEIMYVKIIAVVEYRLFNMLKENISETIKYVAIFWNQVNLIYSKITFPKIKILVTGIMIEEQLDAMTWLTRNASVRDATGKIKYVYPHYAAARSWEYFERIFPLEVDFKNFDTAIIMSHLPVRSPYLEKSHVGGTICHNERYTAYLDDDGNYSGIGRGARVLGLLLSVDHDGIHQNANCVSTRDVGNYMTVHPPVTAKTFIWSECSERAFQSFAYRSDADCLRYPYRKSRYRPYV